MVSRVCVCLRGHVMREENAGKMPDACRICGSKIISKCPSCGKDIALNNISVPDYCQYCKSPFPWSVKMFSKEKFFDFSDLKKDKFLDFSEVEIEEDISD